MRAHRVEEFITQEKLEAGIKALAAEIDRDYEGKELVIICILKGSVYFTTELTKYMKTPLTLEFMQASSYGAETISTGKINIKKDLEESIEGKDVLVLEDILDTGFTLSYLMEILKARNPKSLKLCTMLNKPERRVREVPLDYCIFNIPDEFVVGYGLDYDQHYRNLPYIGIVRFEE